MCVADNFFIYFFIIAGRRSSSWNAGEGERTRSRSGSAGREGGERRRMVEPREVMARMDTPMVQAVLAMDVPQDLVRRAIEHRLRTTGEQGAREAGKSEKYCIGAVNMAERYQ